MTKPKIPNQKKKNEELEKRLAKYSLLIEQIYDTLNREAAKAVGRTDYTADAEEPFKWSDYPETKKRIDDIQAQFVDDIGSTIYRSTSEEWQKSNVVQDLMATRVLRAYNAEVNGKKYKHFFQTNSAALKAFQKRKDKGMNLSAKLWKQADEYKCSLEAAISCAIEKGTSAVTLSKQISRYLVNFPELQKDYKERFGRATDVHDCEYNSMRLARTEINMAYREAENERWRQMDFVVGYEIKVSNNHGCKGVPKGQYHDICDELAGKYPKDFKWTGWHPQCRCYKIPILMTEDEFWEWDGRGEEPSGSVNEIKDVPDNFKRWAEKNSSRIAVAKKRGTLPYFVRDNEKTVETIVREKKLSVIEKAEIRHKNRTTEQIENIKYRAESRRQYILLKNDPNYEDVTLNYDNGGLKAININHNEVKNKGGLYEKIVQDIGYQNGHRVILEAEDNTILGKRNTDGTWDGDLMEIAAAETGTANNIRNALKHCASK